MEKDLEKELKDILEKHEKDKKCCECGIGNGFTPVVDNPADWGLWTLFLIAAIFDKPKEEPKQPIINIYLGGDK